MPNFKYVAKDAQGRNVSATLEVKDKTALVDILRKRGVKGMRLTDVQKRMIIKILESDEFFLDKFANNLYSQHDMFRNCLLQNSSIPPYLIDSVCEDFKG